MCVDEFHSVLHFQSGIKNVIDLGALQPAYRISKKYVIKMPNKTQYLKIRRENPIFSDSRNYNERQNL